MGIFKRTLVAGALALGIASPAAAQFSNVYVLGDSLSDVGAYKRRSRHGLSRSIPASCGRRYLAQITAST